ncbi:hypothetical protein H8E07_06855 [bacterium]|nr:hypothetical protein [bacterium]
MRAPGTIITCLAAVLFCSLGMVDDARASISIDSGLTPAAKRWILRTQVRVMSREAPAGQGDMSMSRLIVPLVIVHGLSSDLTVGARQVYDSRTMTLNGVDTNTSGPGDLYLFAKYKMLRVNTRAYTLGIAPILGIEPPTGADGISSDSWDLYTGLYASGRKGAWALDVNVGYDARGVAGVAQNGADPGDELGLDLSLSRQIPVRGSRRTSLAPVLELTWRTVGANTRAGAALPNSGETTLRIAPGLKFTVDSLIIEGLLSIPVAHDPTGQQLEAGTMGLLGIRWMF